MPDLDLVIIGAGAAGIGAARAAAKAGLIHQVIEASHRIGGRAYTEDLAPGVPFDLGCHWLHWSDINPLVAEADRLGFVIDRNFAFSPHLWLNGRHATEVENKAYGAYFDWAERGSVALPAGEDRDVLSQLDAHSPYFWPYAHVFSVIHAADPDRVSVRDVMSQVTSGGDWPVRDGLGRMMTKLGADIPVSLNTVAEEIDWSSRDQVVVRTNRGNVAARTVLITVSIGILQSGLIKLRPALPDSTLAAIDGFSPGVANRIALYFDRNVFGDASFHNLTIVDGDAEPLAIHIPSFGFNYVVGQTGGRFASHLTRAGQKAATDYVLDRIAAVFGQGIRRHFLRSIVSAWDTDPWVLGAYASVKPGHFGARDRLAEPVENCLFFAGEAVGMPMVATCGGAYWSGTEAIGRIAAALQPA
ncbi:MAG TPA: NAD(P)/FAD-dependent oxidoreductase [Dongiaceae bacterium]|jgi:monoamine oxidase|nr:NAD(P)/FAD-dependent oxidoreductase [Dongiaceae bacterium]